MTESWRSGCVWASEGLSVRRHLCAGVVPSPEVPCAVRTYKRPSCGRTMRMFGARGASRFALLCTHFLALFQLLGPCQSLLGLTLGWWLWDQGCSLRSPDELLHTILQAGKRERFHCSLRHHYGDGGNPAAVSWAGYTQPSASATITASGG